MEADHPSAPAPVAGPRWPPRLPVWLRVTTIQGRLIRDFSLAILVPVLVTAIVGVGMIRQHVFAQAQTQVNASLEAAKEIYQNSLDRLEDAIRIHATRMVIYGALARRDTAGLAEEMDRIRKAEHLDFLTLVDSDGRVFYRSINPTAPTGQQANDTLVTLVLEHLSPAAETDVVPASILERESPALARQAAITIAPTPHARPSTATELRSGMLMRAAAPVTTPAGRMLGVLKGGVLLNRNSDIVDKIRSTVFKEEEYKGRPVGTATIFQDDVRISTNVQAADGTRAIGTRASAEVADEVLSRGGTWRGRAFVVRDWYLSAYAPIRDLTGATIGMLYVGVLEQPFTDSLWRSLLVFLGIAAGGVALVDFIAARVARRISGPIHDLTLAAHRIAQGDYTTAVQESTDDELGDLAHSFNTMSTEVESAHQALRESADELERKVEARTAELRRMQAQMIQSEKLVAIGKLAAGVAHEINNPLTGVLTNSSLMLEDMPDDHPWREDVQTIVNETLRCRKIVKGLLDFSRQTKPQRTLLDDEPGGGGRAVARPEPDGVPQHPDHLRPRFEAAGRARRCRPDAPGRAEHRPERGRGDGAGRRVAPLVVVRCRGQDDRRRHRRHGAGHPRRRPRAHLRALLHHEEDRDRPRAGRRLRHHGAPSRRTAHRHRAGPRHHLHDPAADRGDGGR